jgi:hypothetical protein
LPIPLWEVLISGIILMAITFTVLLLHQKIALFIRRLVLVLGTSSRNWSGAGWQSING